MAQTTIIAHATATEDFNATINVSMEPTILSGSATDKSAKVQTDDVGNLLFEFTLEANSPGISWNLDLTVEDAPKPIKTCGGVTDENGEGKCGGNIKVK